jgi:DNA processing protein
MENQGGLLTEFPYDTGPQVYQFPLRNRVIAGMSDALVVIETARQGGSLGAVKMAQEYRKNIFAIPGRIHDGKSAGCNDLIRDGKARLLIDAQQLMTAMNWKSAAQPVRQPSLFPPLLPGLKEPDNNLLGILRGKDSVSLDELAEGTSLDISSIAVALLNLELRGEIIPLPGKRYRLLNE